jgi:hypothetical protein
MGIAPDACTCMHDMASVCGRVAYVGARLWCEWLHVSRGWRLRAVGLATTHFQRIKRRTAVDHYDTTPRLAALAPTVCVVAGAQLLPGLCSSTWRHVVVVVSPFIHLLCGCLPMSQTCACGSCVVSLTLSSCRRPSKTTFEPRVGQTRDRAHSTQPLRRPRVRPCARMHVQHTPASSTAALSQIVVFRVEGATGQQLVLLHEHLRGQRGEHQQE